MPETISEALHTALTETAPSTPKADQPPTPDPSKTPDTKASQEPVWEPETPQERSLAKRFAKSISKMDAEERQDFIKKTVESDRKREDVERASAGMRRFIAQLQEQFGESITTGEIVEALSKHRKGSASDQAEMRGIDALIEETDDPAIRKELKKSKQVFKEEFDKQVREAVEAAVKDLRQDITDLKSMGLSERSSVVESEIDALSEEEHFPDSFIEKHREAIRAAALKYRLPVLEVIPKVVPYADLKEALAEAHTVASNSSSRTSSAARAPERTPTASAATQQPDVSSFKDKQGHWDFSGAMRALGKSIGIGA